MTARASGIDLDDIQTTATEKILAVILAIFFLIGGVWGYGKLDDLARSIQSAPDTYLTASEQVAVDRASAAAGRVSAAEVANERALAALELAREAYRTELDAGRDSRELEQAYEGAQADLAASAVELEAARAELSAAQPAADAASRRAADAAEADRRQAELLALLARLALVLAVLGGGYALLLRLQRVGSRYLPVAFSLIATAGVLALALAGDYVTDYIDVQELGPLVLSLAGIALTLAVFWWVQRLIARRVPARRVRKGECAACGYPLRGGEHCEGCGRPAVDECTSCHAPRRVGTAHCAACGAH
jgi:hypothetical protein